ncbi:aspartate/glutamate racemase family protein [Mangrovibacter phragmitis]|uniref:aspartate/glutamate racemase family protein n=1 Tax=Mangrovibacter phragmitis TaxID=1691903 RepID=UPI003519B8A2
MIRIACLHTAPGNETLFEQAAQDTGLPAGCLKHTVMPQLLRTAEASGGLTSALEDDVIRVLLALSHHADAVLLTCSTLGPAVDKLNQRSPVSIPVLRVDRALAQAAMAQGKRTVVLCATQTTVEPTRVLFELSRQQPEQELETRLIPGAWDAFLQGDQILYHERIIAAVQRALTEGAECVALAQASMSSVSKYLPACSPVLTSPHLALEQLKQRLFE